MKTKILSLIALVLFSSSVSSSVFAQTTEVKPNTDSNELIWYAVGVNTFPTIKRATLNTEPALQVPTRLFDVRNGNGLTENSVTYPRATYIAFKDNASKDAIIDAVCAMGGYQATIPNPAYGRNVEGSQPTIANPQTKQAFFNKRIEQFLRDNYRAWKTSAAEKAAKATAETAADVELPPNQ